MLMGEWRRELNLVFIARRLNALINAIASSTWQPRRPRDAKHPTRRRSRRFPSRAASVLRMADAGDQGYQLYGSV